MALGKTIGTLIAKMKLDTTGLQSGEKSARRTLYNLDKSTRTISGGITRSLGSIATSLGATFAIGSVVAGATRTITGFEQAIADLASISGKSIKETGRLAKSAKEIGAISAFSASQVVALQTELAKLGFDEREIIASTKAIGDFSIAVGTDAASAAQLAGAVLRSFGKDASEAEGVVSSLAVATTKSALDFEKLNTSLAIVGPIARASNVSLERVTALLGVLANNGVDASTAGTSLRNIFIQLAKKGITYEEAMEKINSSTNKAAVAAELFDVRSATAAITLARSAEEANNLEKSITGVDGALKEMTDKRLDTTKGQLILLNSAWEGLLLTVDSGNGIITKSFKFIIDGASGLLTAITELNEGSVGLKNFFLLAFGDKELRDLIQKDLVRIRDLKKEILDIREDDFLKIEKKKTDLLEEREKLNKKIKILEERKTNDVLGFDDQTIKKYSARINEINKELQRGESLGKKLIASTTTGRVGGGLGTLEEQIKRTKAQIEGYEKSLSSLDKESQEYKVTQQDLETVQVRLNKLQKEQLGTVTGITDATSDAKEEIKSFGSFFQEELKKGLETKTIDEFKEKYESIGKLQSGFESLTKKLELDVELNQKSLSEAINYINKLDTSKIVEIDINSDKIVSGLDAIKTSISVIPEEKLIELGISLGDLDSDIAGVINKVKAVPAAKLIEFGVNPEKLNFAIEKVESFVTSIPKEKRIELGLNSGNAVRTLSETVQLMQSIPNEKLVQLGVNPVGFEKTLALIGSIPEEVFTKSLVNNPDISGVLSEYSKIPQEIITKVLLALDENNVRTLIDQVQAIETKPLYIKTIAEQNRSETVTVNTENQGDPAAAVSIGVQKQIEQATQKWQLYNTEVEQTKGALASIGLASDQVGNGILSIGNAVAVGSQAFAQFAEDGIKSVKDLANALLKSGIAIVSDLIRQGIAAAVANTLKGSSIFGLAAIPIAAAAGAAAASLFRSILPAAPKLAKGGIAIGEQLVTVGDNPSGREAIIPLERLPRMLEELSGGSSELYSFIRNGHIFLANQQGAVNYGRRWG